MSFTDNAAEVLDRTEASLNSLITDALKAKAYREIATVAAMAESVAAISPGRSRDGKRISPSADVGVGVRVGVGTPSAADSPKSAEPSWMRPKTP